MSAIKIKITSEGYEYQIPRTHVYVDGKHAYRSQTHPSIEKDQIHRLLDLLTIENVEIEIKS